MISDLLHRTLKGAPQIILSFEFTSVSSTLFIVTKVQAQVKVFVTLLYNQKYIKRCYKMHSAVCV